MQAVSRWRQRVILYCWLLSVLVGRFSQAAPAGELEEAFAHPPASARPLVNWFWLDGNITQEGITADLEAMQRAGLGGVVLMDITQEIPPGNVRFASPEWRALFKHTLKEAERLGLEVSMHNAPGWCGSGGPWITPELAMQKLVWTKTNLAGPTHFNGRLPPVTGALSSQGPVAVLAYPTPVGEGAPVPGFAPKITSSAGPIQSGNLLDNNPNTIVSLPVPSGRKRPYLQLEFSEPFSASVLKLTAPKESQSFQGVLQVSDNGSAFRDVREFMSSRGNLSVEFETVSARFFRVVFTQADARLTQLEFSELELAPVFRIEHATQKSGLARQTLPMRPVKHSEVPVYGVTPLDKVMDLTERTGQDGTLVWDVPAGEWTVIQFRAVPTGQMNRPARPGGIGLECDKLSREAMEAHYSAFLGQLIEDAGDLAGHAFTGTHIDSWEVGFQNWTPRFQEEFRRRRGYDPRLFLPAFSGRIVNSLGQSERFLWDVRRTVADLVADNYAGRLAELAHQHGLKLSVEAYGNGPVDSLLYASRADVPMSEFWAEVGDFNRFYTSRCMASAAHTYGKSVVAAEAFTSHPLDGRWLNHPYSLKPLGDGAFCAGVNRLMFHRYAHQPWLDRRPGMTMGPWGVQYERTETWWESSRAWHEYIARCQALLQRGLFVADVCYVSDEGAYVSPAATAQLEPALPRGYDYDQATPEVVLTRMSVQDGRLLLPDGMSYQVLVLPQAEQMTPQLLRKLKELVAGGATIVAGAPPRTSPSLTGYPQCDAEVKQLAGELWGACDGQTICENRLGKGRLIRGKPLAKVLAEAGAPPDFVQITRTAGYELRRIHRSIKGGDFYFLANSNAQPVTAECTFRVSGRQPEFWYPDSGRIESAGLWREQGGDTLVTLKLEPAGSVFVVFRRPTAPGAQAVMRVLRNGKSDLEADVRITSAGQVELRGDQPGVYELETVSGQHLRGEIKQLPGALTLGGPWNLRFPARSGAPAHLIFERLIPWNEHTDPGVKYFSGTATYSTRFKVPAEFPAANRSVFLDLGRVSVIAEVKVNGRDLGTSWKPPFRLEITEAVKAGDNELEVKVVNLWPNRMIGDEQLPPDCRWRDAQGDAGSGLLEWPDWLLQGKPSPTGRFTFSTWKFWKKDSPLVGSGLLGPVTLQAVETATLR